MTGWYNAASVVLRVFCVSLLSLVMMPLSAGAQTPPPRIGPWVVDLHATVPRFPQDAQLAQSRAIDLGELPGAGLGLHGGAHVYPFSWKAITFGIGVDATVARAHRGAVALSATALSRPTTERLWHVAPDISFNFGTGDGWSYLSGGIGPATWLLKTDAADRAAPDRERLQTINYGGGARWFNTPRLAFSIDVRFYALNPSTPVPGSARPTSPRTTLLFIGAGLSLK